MMDPEALSFVQPMFSLIQNMLGTTVLYSPVDRKLVWQILLSLFRKENDF
jgi:hypothetical protein